MKVHLTEQFSLKLHEQTLPPTLPFSLKMGSLLSTGCFFVQKLWLFLLGCRRVFYFSERYHLAISHLIQHSIWVKVSVVVMMWFQEWELSERHRKYLALDKAGAKLSFQYYLRNMSKILSVVGLPQQNQDVYVLVYSGYSLSFSCKHWSKSFLQQHPYLSLPYTCKGEEFLPGQPFLILFIVLFGNEFVTQSGNENEA